MALGAQYFGRHVPGLPNADEIIAICAQNGFASNGLAYSPNGSPIAYIKYGYTVTMGEMWTQRHVSNYFKQMMDVSNVNAPEIYYAFECEGQTYIIMEYVNGQTVGTLLQDSLTDKHWIYDQVAKAVSQLLRVPVPEGSRPGPVGGGYAQHCFFRGEVAPKEYASVDELQRYINKVLLKPLLSYTPSLAHLQFNKFSHLVVVMKKLTSLTRRCVSATLISGRKNFFITKDGQIYVIDFQHAAFLPTSFMNFILRKPTKPLVPKITAMVSLPESVNLSAMNRTSYILKIASDNMIGKNQSADYVMA